MEADGGSGKAVDVVTPWAGLDVHIGSPVAAVVIEAGTGGQGDDAIAELRVTAVQPDGCVGAAVVLLDAERWHGVTGHASESVPLTRNVSITQGHTSGVVDVILCVAPRLI